MKKTIMGITLALLLSVSLVACGGGGRHYARQTYCADQFGNVVDPGWCDFGTPYYHSGYSYYVGTFGGHRYSPGQVINHTYIDNRKTVTVVNPTDTAARSRAGLPATGHVNSGRTVPTARAATSRAARTTARTAAPTRVRTQAPVRTPRR